MSEQLKSIEEIRELVKSENNALQSTPHEETKALGEVDVNDIRFKLDTTKSFEQQAEDVVGAMAIAKAVSDESTAKDLAVKKAEELKTKASQKLKKAKTDDIIAETEWQEAKRSKNEAVLQTFGINKHLPEWLLRIMVVLFSPIYILFTILIGVPCGIVKVIIDNIDNILVRYEKANETNRPKIKIAVWVILVLCVLATATFILLKCLNII